MPVRIFAIFPRQFKGALQGKAWKGIYRRRIGDYRVLFTADYTNHKVLVLRILIRSGDTYQ